MKGYLQVTNFSSKLNYFILIHLVDLEKFYKLLITF